MKKAMMFVLALGLCARLFAQGSVFEAMDPAEDVLSAEAVNSAEAAEDQPVIQAELSDDRAAYELAGVPVVNEDQPAATPASGKPKIAVYVTGGRDAAEGKALGTYILEALVRSSRYVAIERTEAFLAEIDNEQVRQRSGAIDDAQISRLGKQSGVRFVCVADITQALRGSVVSARVLDVETAEVSAVGVAESPLKTIDDLKRVSVDVVAVMLGIEVARERRVSFAGRLAYNNTYVSKYRAEAHYFDESMSKLVSKYGYNETGPGSGFEVGVSTILHIAGPLAAEVGTSYAWRKPITVDGVYSVSESALMVPALLRGTVSARIPVYIQGGIQLEVPLGTKVKFDKGGESKDEIDREPIDFSLIIGAGYKINRFLSADIRAVHGLNSFDGGNDHLLYQVSAGISYIY